MTRAAASGRAAVKVVDRTVQVDRTVSINERVEADAIPHGAEWPDALAALVIELDTGRLYDRDLPALGDALAQVLNALDRRPGWRRRPNR